MSGGVIGSKLGGLQYSSLPEMTATGSAPSCQTSEVVSWGIDSKVASAPGSFW
jgi:hypothetical protein